MLVNCLECNLIFRTYPSKINEGRGKYCSKLCSNKNTLIRKGQRLSCETEIKRGEPLPESWKQKMSGRTAWNKGLPFVGTKTDKWRQALIKQGQQLSPQTQFKIGTKPPHAGKKRPELSGKYHHNWKGGITDQLRADRQSLEMKLWKKSVLKMCNFKCMRCKKRGGDLEVDHVFPFSLYHNMRFATKNGQVLCKSCHKIKTRNDKKIFKDYTVCLLMS